MHLQLSLCIAHKLVTVVKMLIFSRLLFWYDSSLKMDKIHVNCSFSHVRSQNYDVETLQEPMRVILLRVTDHTHLEEGTCHKDYGMMSRHREETSTVSSQSVLEVCNHCELQ